MGDKKQETMDGSPPLVTLYGSHKFGVQSDEPYVMIKFQAGPIQEVGVNGCSIEDVIDILVARLEGFQKGPFKCQENAEAILSLIGAKSALDTRTQRRQDQGVEGTMQPHKVL